MIEHDPLEKEQLEKLSELAHELDDARTNEREARQRRIEIEEKIAAIVPTDEEAQRTIAIKGGMRLTVKRSLLYKADTEEIAQTLCRLSLMDGCRYHPPIKTTTKVELDVVGYKWYRENSPKAWKAISEYVTVKPAKTAVTLRGK